VTWIDHHFLKPLSGPERSESGKGGAEGDEAKKDPEHRKGG
jgi:hypothetical protein